MTTEERGAEVVALRTYLQTHFEDKPAFADRLGVTIERLDELIAAGACPGPSYICDGSSIRSAAFGSIEIRHGPPGEYFRRQCAKWTLIANEAPPGRERQALLAALTGELDLALRASIGDAEEIQGMIRALIAHFFAGTLGLCVADPSTGTGIVTKELLQMRLVELTQNGCNASPSGCSRVELLQLIDDYAACTMEFSQAEYPRSSRKRLVDDLRAAVTMG